jgi:hypothetical protein
VIKIKWGEHACPPPLDPALDFDSRSDSKTKIVIAGSSLTAAENDSYQGIALSDAARAAGFSR